MRALTFNNWINEKYRPLRNLSDLPINRRYRGQSYEYELFPRFRRLQKNYNIAGHRPKLEDWFMQMQALDNDFYTLVITGELGQPDVRELWRDITGQKSSRMKKLNLA